MSKKQMLNIYCDLDNCSSSSCAYCEFSDDRKSDKKKEAEALERETSSASGRSDYRKTSGTSLRSDYDYKKDYFAVREEARQREMDRRRGPVYYYDSRQMKYIKISDGEYIDILR